MPENQPSNDYISFRVSTLRGDQKIDFNAYLRINEKYILYVRKGDSFEGDRIRKLKKNKLREMYIHTDEVALYRQYIERNLESAYDPKSKTDLQSRAEIVQGAQENCAEEVFENPDSALAYQQARNSIEKYTGFLLSENQAFRAIMNVENADQNIAHHGVSVATLAIILMQQINFDPKQIPLVALGALLHDFDHYHNKVPLQIPTEKLTGEDLIKYRHHPRQGAEAIKDKRHIDPLILKIILQHEETIDGSGFPNQLRERDLEPGSIIVGAANAIDRLTTFQGLTRNEARKIFKINYMGLYPLDYIQKLSDLLTTLS